MASSLSAEGQFISCSALLPLMRVAALPFSASQQALCGQTRRCEERPDHRPERAPVPPSSAEDGLSR